MYGPSTLLSALSKMVLLWPCHVLGSKRANSCPTIAEILPIVKFHLPQQRKLTSSGCTRGLFELFTSCQLSPPLHFKERKLDF